MRPLMATGAIALAATIHAPATTRLQFTDITSASGITFRHEASKTAQKFLPETMGGGVAIFDADGDGRLDLFFTNGAAIAAGALAERDDTGGRRRCGRSSSGRSSSRRRLGD